MRIDDIIDDVRSAGRFVEPALAVIAVAQAATGLGGRTAEQAIAMIRAALDTFDDVAAGAVTEDQALASLAALRDGLVSGDARADAELAARFPGEGG